ncbi:hypothetical protein AMECASPLE_003271 [Ameca splendens]|uniref:Secreted protein n=1 Tax=Ameca splendens TaxID=208324 RepID=A0ABV0YA63_9TELE
MKHPFLFQTPFMSQQLLFFGLSWIFFLLSGKSSPCSAERGNNPLNHTVVSVPSPPPPPHRRHLLLYSFSSRITHHAACVPPPPPLPPLATVQNCSIGSCKMTASEQKGNRLR